MMWCFSNTGFQSGVVQAEFLSLLPLTDGNVQAWGDTASPGHRLRPRSHAKNCVGVCFIDCALSNMPHRTKGSVSSCCRV